ncbi:hypothetical protein HDU77_006302 [Chytriomyces hyalinus]|nr:hypothetical protein HDU77_006302 [Chytriomyces hyalinus]
MEETHQGKRPVACESCHKSRKKCDFAVPSCARCVKRGTRCVYEYVTQTQASIAPAPDRTAANTCEKCRLSKRKCDRALPCCSRCLASGWVCVYDTNSKEKGSPSNKLINPSMTPISNASSSQSPSILDTSNDFSWLCLPSSFMGNITTVEDPDLMPSMKDWELLCKFLTNGTFSLLNYLLPRGFLESLFSQPPGIRLTWGAIAAYLSAPRLSNEICASYFSRAQKAVSRCFHRVSLESMQACVLISYFVLVSGRPRAAAPFHNQSIKLMYALQLEIDPDNILVAAAHPFMSEQEKQARRITFWVTFYCVRLMQSVVVRSHGIRQITIKSDKIKPAKTIYYDKYNGLIEATATVCHLVSILDAIELVKSHHYTVPQTVSQVIYPSSFEALSSHLNTLRYQLPLHLLCNNFTCPPSVFLDNIANDASHTRKSTIIETLYDAIMVSMTFNSAKCILYRPQLYLTYFLKLDGPSLLDNPKAITTLLTAIDESMKSARKITQLNSWLVMNPNWSAHLHFVFSAFSLFEACVICWFLTCRTRSFWFWNGAPFSSASSPVIASPYLTNQMGSSDACGGGGGGDSSSLSLSMEERRAIRSELLDAIISLKAIEVSFAMAGPLRECVEAMVVEMAHVEEQILLGVAETEGMMFPGGDASFRSVGIELDKVLIGMKSMAIGDDGEMREKVGEGWAFLGLLGVSIGKGVRWNAFYEDSWARFWSTVR